MLPSTKMQHAPSNRESPKFPICHFFGGNLVTILFSCSRYSQFLMFKGCQKKSPCDILMHDSLLPQNPVRRIQKGGNSESELKQQFKKCHRTKTNKARKGLQIADFYLTVIWCINTEHNTIATSCWRSFSLSMSLVHMYPPKRHDSHCM